MARLNFCLAFGAAALPPFPPWKGTELRHPMVHEVFPDPGSILSLSRFVQTQRSLSCWPLVAVLAPCTSPSLPSYRLRDFKSTKYTDFLLMLLPKYREQLDTSIWGMRAICWRYSKEFSSKFSFPPSTCHSNYRQPSPSKQPPEALPALPRQLVQDFSSISFFADSLVVFSCFFPSINF